MALMRRPFRRGAKMLDQLLRLVRQANRDRPALAIILVDPARHRRRQRRGQRLDNR
jgi:hypothetical protein